MGNRNRYIVALGVLCALGFFSGASSVDEAFMNVGSLGVGEAVYAQEDDPFGDDPFEEDPFEGEPSDASDEDPFDAPSSSGPFAPSKLSTSESGSLADEKSSVPVAVESNKDVNPFENARRPEDIPDEEKVIDDFVKTMNSAERAIIGSNPNFDDWNSVELFAAAARVARVGRPYFSKALLELAASADDPEPAQAAATLDSLGSGRATYLVALSEVGVLGSEIYEKVTSIARKAWEGETALREAISRVEQGSTESRASAIVDLRRGGSAAVQLLYQDLTTGDSASSATARNVLPFFESDAVEALIVATRNATPEALVSVVSLLGEQQDLRVGPALLALSYDRSVDESLRATVAEALSKQYDAIPTEAEFARDSYQKALGYFKRTELFPRTVDGETEIWRWDAENAVPSKALVPTEQAYLEEAARLAQLAYRVGVQCGAVPVNALELAIVATSELEQSRGVVDTATNLQSLFADATLDDIQNAIRFAIDRDRCRAALLPTIWLRDVGDESVVSSYNEPSAIVKAALCADRRVRFEAISAIIKWNPQGSYIGSTRVGRMLEWFMTSTGAKVAVVASPKLDECGRIGRVLQQQGYKILPATTGRDALLAAQGCADVELIVASATIGLPDPRVIAQTLRADARTFDVPLLVGSLKDGEDTSANLLVGKEPNAFVYPMPYDLESCSMALQRLFDYTKPRQTTAEERFAQGKAASRAFLALSQASPEFYDFSRMNEITRRMINTPVWFEEGLEYAASLKTNYAQNVLVETICDSRYTMEQRNKALDAFGRQLSANGSLLRGPEIGKMYERYNASETADAETQALLSKMLDVFEQATEKK